MAKLYIINVRESGFNAKVAIVLGSIQASSDTVESEGRQMKQCKKNPPLLHKRILQQGFYMFLNLAVSYVGFEIK